LLSGPTAFSASLDASEKRRIPAALFNRRGVAALLAMRERGFVLKILDLIRVEAIDRINGGRR